MKVCSILYATYTEVSLTKVFWLIFGCLKAPFERMFASSPTGSSADPVGSPQVQIVEILLNICLFSSFIPCALCCHIAVSLISFQFSRDGVVKMVMTQVHKLYKRKNVDVIKTHHLLL